MMMILGCRSLFLVASDDGLLLDLLHQVLLITEYSGIVVKKGLTIDCVALM